MAGVTETPLHLKLTHADGWIILHALRAFRERSRGLLTEGVEVRRSELVMRFEAALDPTLFRVTRPEDCGPDDYVDPEVMNA